jgi:protein ImuA
MGRGWWNWAGPAAITLLLLPDALGVLRAGLDALRHGGASVLIDLPSASQPPAPLRPDRQPPPGAGRRTSGALALVLRAPRPARLPRTRWQVAAAPSAALEANAPGHPAFALTLLRHRGGRRAGHPSCLEPR